MKKTIIIIGLIVVMLGGSAGYLYYQRLQYLKAVSLGDEAYNAHDYKKALEFYQKAHTMKASDATNIRIRQTANALVSEQNPVETVEDCFAAFQRYARYGDGLFASTLISNNTFEWYEQVRKIAIGKISYNLEKLPQMKVFLVLELRYVFSKEQLEAMTGENIFMWDAKENLDTPTIQEFRIKSVSYEENDVAFADLTMKGMPRSNKGGITVMFYQQDGFWKFDLAAFFDFLDFIFLPFRALNGKNKVETAMHFLSNEYGKKLPSIILKEPRS